MVQVEGLTKYYGSRCALDRVSFRVDHGEIVGLLGLNGSGKTTLLRILAGHLLPTSGTVTVQGRDLYQDPFRLKRSIGFLPETPPLYGDMTVASYLLFVARLKGLTRKEARLRLEEVEAEVDLAHVRDEIIDQLSFGYRQRVGIAQALIHDPEVLLLDEPAAGLDPVQIVEMRELIQGLRGSRTVLLSSHILSEIRQICDRILVIQEGRIVAEGPEEELARKLRPGMRVRIQVRGGGDRVRQCLAAVDGIDDIAGARQEGDQATFLLSLSKDVRDRIASALVRGGIGLLEMSRADLELENVFLGLLEQTGAAG
jgi:ABC-2 type transport system ATP-binding protein